MTIAMREARGLDDSEISTRANQHRLLPHSLYESSPCERRNFVIAIICALEVESTAVLANFDEIYNQPLDGRGSSDQNCALGRIGQHHVVLVHLPYIGKKSSAAAAERLRASFEIKLCLVVGVCGGVPPERPADVQSEVLLGDVIISTQVIQYEYGRQYDKSYLARRDTVRESLGRGSTEVLGFLHKCQAGLQRRELQRRLNDYIIQTCQQSEMQSFARLPADRDILYPPDYVHSHRTPGDCTECLKPPANTSSCAKARESTCDDLRCDRAQAVARQRLRSTTPTTFLHFGAIASGDLVVKSGRVRNDIAESHNVIAFETEGAGFWDIFPTLVIKGVCDYADSHKHKEWQKHAAVAAASAAKALLDIWPAVHSGFRDPFPAYITMSPEISTSLPRSSHQNVPSLPTSLWYVRFKQEFELVGCDSEIERVENVLFSSEKVAKVLAIEGLGGIGKSRLALEIAYRAKRRFSAYWICWLQCSDADTFDRDCYNLALELGIPGAVETKIPNAKKLLKRFLEKTDAARWLLVFDGADDETLWSAHAAADDAEALIHFVPRCGHRGAVLITTRNRIVAADMAQIHNIELHQLAMVDSRRMLEKHLVNPAVMQDMTATSQLLNHLTHLPLAIRQAAAYINQRRGTNIIREYLDIWDNGVGEDIMKLLDKDFMGYNRYPDVKNAIAKTWLISIRDITRSHPIAITLLSYMSCLCSNSIQKSSLPRSVGSLSDQSDAFDTLSAYAFIQVQECQSNDTTYDMHRLVHLASRKYFQHQGTFSAALDSVAKHLCTLLPKDGLGTGSYWHRYVPHAERIVSANEAIHNVTHHELQELLSSAYFE